MKLLIVEDDLSCREMLAQTAVWLAEQAGMELEIPRTGILDEAMLLLEEADAALSDGSFSTTLSDSLYGRTRENWPFIAGLAAQRRIPFALLSGDYRSVTKARAGGHLAFEKPAGVQPALTALLGALALRAQERNSKLEIRNSKIGGKDGKHADAA
jgi:hypothetical protein